MRNYFLPISPKLFLIIPHICEDMSHQSLSCIIVVRIKWYNDLAILFIYALVMSERIRKNIVKL